MPRVVRVLVDRAPTNMRVQKQRGGTYCPDVVLCVDQDTGLIYHEALLNPDEGEKAIGAAAQAALAAVGRGGPGARVVWVTRHEQVARALAACLGEADIWSEPSESFGAWDEAYMAMDRQLGSGRGVLPYLWRRDITADEVGALFAAAAHFHRMRPWEFVADSELLEKPSPEAGGKPLLISVIGASGISRGLVLFDSEDDFERMMAEDRGVDAVFASFERVAEVPNVLKREAEQHGWELASKSAFPDLLRLRRGEPQPCSGADLRRVTAALRAVAEATSAYRRSDTKKPPT